MRIGEARVGSRAQKDIRTQGKSAVSNVVCGRGAGGDDNVFVPLRADVIVTQELVGPSARVYDIAVPLGNQHVSRLNVLGKRFHDKARVAFATSDVVDGYYLYIVVVTGARGKELRRTEPTLRHRSAHRPCSQVRGLAIDHAKRNVIEVDA